MKGELLYTIRNKYWTFFCNKTFVIDANGERVATIKKRKFSFNLKYQIEDTENEMSIEGKWFKGESHVLRNGQIVATIKRDFNLVNDSFILEADESEIAYFTALVIAFDNIQDARNKERD